MSKILLVEDDDDSRDALSRRLERRGYEVIVAADGRKGVALADTAGLTLILLDMNLPEIDGWEVARILKAKPETATIPIIALTAHAMSGDREKALGAGCDDYHSKPIDLTRLLSQIEAIIPRRE